MVNASLTVKRKRLIERLPLFYFNNVSYICEHEYGKLMTKFNIYEK